MIALPQVFRSKSIWLAVMAVMIFFTPGWARLPDPQPPVVRFESDLDVFPQNFAVESDVSGNIFLGNGEGVQIFDGEAWQLVSLPNGELVRALDSDGQLRIYVGGFNEVGYLKQAPQGEFRYESLTARFQEALAGEDFADIWSVNVSPFGVFFVGIEHLLLYNPENGQTTLWRSEDGFGPINTWNEKVYLQWVGEGLKSFDGASWTLHPNLAMEWDLLAGLVPLENDLLIVNNEGPWLRYRNQTFTELDHSSEIPLKDSMTSAFAVGENLIGAATMIGVMVFHDLSAGASTQIRVSNGFVSDASVTADGDILSVDDLGFAAVSWPAQWKIIDARSGLNGSVSAIQSFGNQSYVLTSSGVYAAENSSTRFERLPWTADEAWDLLPLAAGGALLADSYEIKWILPNGKIRALDEHIEGRLLVASDYDQDVVYVGTESGIRVLRNRAEEWQVELTKEDFGNLSTATIVETGPNELWIGSDRGGIYQLTINSDRSQITARPIDAGQGLEYEDRVEGAYVYEVKGDLIASTAKGLFRFNGERFEPHQIANDEAVQIPGRTLSLATDGDQLWAYHFNRLFRLDTSGRWAEQDIDLIGNSAISVVEVQPGRVLIGGLAKILSYEEDIAGPEQQPGTLKLTRAEILHAGGFSTRLPLDTLQMSTADERVMLNFALTDLRRPESVQYRTRLAPLESNFTSWSDSPQRSYVNLEPGTYQVIVESVSDSHLPMRLELPLQVNPQWHEAAMFRVPSTALALFFLVAAVRYLGYRRSRILEQRNEILEQHVAERTQELQAANQKLDRMAHLDGLTQIPNRRRLDAYLEEVREQCFQRHRPLAVALFDVDHFKRYNDTFGHQAGDTLLVELAKLLSNNLRRTEDLVARYGGEEFLVAMPGADRDSAFSVVETMRLRVEESDLGVTVSVGLNVETPDEDTSVPAMIEKADKFLYSAKNGGRNQVVLG